MSNFPFELPITLENDRVRLTPLKLTDAELLWSIAKHKDLLQYSPADIHTPELLEQYITTALSRVTERNSYPFLIYDKQTDKVAGSTRFGNISEYDSRLEIGWTWIGTEFQGTGLNGACKQLLLHYAFESLDYERVELRIDERNIRSRKATEKLGCQMEGVLRHHVLMPDGHRRNTVYYSMLSKEWFSRKKAK